MKNLFIGLAAIALLGATSCKKEQTCACAYTMDGTAVSSLDSKVTLKDTKKKNKDACDKLSSKQGAVEVKCAIK